MGRRERDQLTYRLDWITFERARELLQQEGYVLLSGSDRRSMIKWIQNPKYYHDTKENLINKWFVRKDKLEQHDLMFHNLLLKDWWYKHKAWLEDPQNNSILNEIIQSWEKMFEQLYPYLLRSFSFPESV